MRLRLAALFLLVSAGLAPAADYTLLGQYYANSKGSTDIEQLVHWPNSSGEYGNVLRWGYNIWNRDRVEPTPPPPGWIVSKNLCVEHDIPANATAVRLHIKAKIAGLTWAPEAMNGAVQLKWRALGETDLLNEMIHSTTQKPANFMTTTPYDLNHVEVDVRLGPDCKIEMFRYPTITGRMLIEVAVFLAGYWAPVE